jgi:hypothetical protein
MTQKTPPGKPAAFALRKGFFALRACGAETAQTQNNKVFLLLFVHKK